MKLNTVLAVNAVVTFAYGAGLMLLPDWTLGQFGVEASAAVVVLARLVGAALIVFGMLALAARGAGEAVARQLMVPAFLTRDLLGFAVTLVGQLAKVTNSTGWINVVIYGLFALAYGYFMWTMPSGRKAAPARRSGGSKRRR
jgi:hypothetical protein